MHLYERKKEALHMTGEEYIKSLSGEEFLKVVSGVGKCKRCSNSYWDGNQELCHKNINDSSCELGLKEYLESDISENLQTKYKKKRLTDIKYEDWIKEDICESRNCEWCSSNPFDDEKPECHVCVSAHEAAELQQRSKVKEKFKKLIIDIYNKAKEGNLVGIIYGALSTYGFSDIRDINEFVENHNPDMLHIESKLTNTEIDVYCQALEGYKIKDSESTIYVKLKKKNEVRIMY